MQWNSNSIILVEVNQLTEPQAVNTLSLRFKGHTLNEFHAAPTQCRRKLKNHPKPTLRPYSRAWIKAWASSGTIKLGRSNFNFVFRKRLKLSKSWAEVLKIWGCWFSPTLTWINEMNSAVIGFWACWMTLNYWSWCCASRQKLSLKLLFCHFELSRSTFWRNTLVRTERDLIIKQILLSVTDGFLGISPTHEIFFSTTTLLLKQRLRKDTYFHVLTEQTQTNWGRDSKTFSRYKELLLLPIRNWCFFWNKLGFPKKHNSSTILKIFSVAWNILKQLYWFRKWTVSLVFGHFWFNIFQKSKNFDQNQVLIVWIIKFDLFYFYFCDFWS